MAHFNVGDGVFAIVQGFEPFPAVVQSVVLNESLPCIYYHVKFLGSKQAVALDAENLLPFDENKKTFKINYSSSELENGAKLRETVLLGEEDEFPDVLMNFVTVDDQFEEVSNEDVKRLGLSNIILSASDLINNLENVSLHSTQGKNSSSKHLDDDFIDIEEVSWKESQSFLLQNQVKQRVALSCNSCSKTYQSMASLRKHKQISSACKNFSAKKKGTFDSPKKRKSLLIQSKTSNPNLLRKPKKIERETYSISSTSDDSCADEIFSSHHSRLERQRRADLAKIFSELAETVGITAGGSKVSILSVATNKISELVTEADELQEQMSLLKDINLRLTARLTSLSGNFCSPIF